MLILIIIHTISTYLYYILNCYLW